MGEWGAIAISLGLLLIISIFMTNLGLALDVASSPTDDIIYINETISNGFSINFLPVVPDFHINLIPVFAREFMINLLNGFSLIPLIIRLPLLLFIGALFTYGTIKLLPTT